MNESQQKPIFFDETHRRWGVFSTLMVTLSVICVIAAVIFLISIARNPQLPDVALARIAEAQPDPSGRHTVVQKTPPGLHVRGGLRFVIGHDAAIQEAKRKLVETISREEAPQPIPAAAIAPGHVAGPVRAAFFVNSDKSSLDSLQQHVAQTTHLFPVWLLLSPDGSKINSIASFSAQAGPGQGLTNDDIAVHLARRHGVAILPLIQNYDSDGDSFRSDWLHKLLSSPAHSAALIAQLLGFVTKGHYQGINIDFETDQASDRDGLTAFMAGLAAAFHPRGLLVTQDVQTDSDAYALPTLSKVDDFLIPMLYDEHSSGDPAGPIASLGWFQSELKQFTAHVPAGKVVIGLGNYGYDWHGAQTDADEVSFEQAAQLAQESRSSGDGDDGIIRIDSKSLNPCFTYYDDVPNQETDAAKHTVWLQDATTALNEMRAAQPYHPLGAALWRLGTEDPSLWTFFGKNSSNSLSQFSPQNLTDVTYNYFGTQFEGAGDVLDVIQAPTPGKRTISVDHAGWVTGETFRTYPSQFVIRRTGLVNQQTEANDLPNSRGGKGYIALTFDDGPDPRWTPQILDILDRYHVKATFFVVGENAESHPVLLEREWNEGMEIGNHSFTHPEMDTVSPLRTRLELDATQRVIEAMTGHMTTLWRAPNRADSEPSTMADFAPILQGDKLGYLFIGEKVDPTDWLPGIQAPQIVKSVLGNARNGNCVLMHDAGGDTRAETIKALPTIIEGLQKEGYQFVTVSQLIGRPRSQIFPAVTGPQRWTVLFDRAFFDMTYWLGSGFGLLFLLTIFLGIGRILFTGVLAAIQAKREKARTFDPDFAPPVSIIIAAYNETKVINRTIETLLASDYKDLDIVVVDDGSKDDTFGVVQAAYGDHPRVNIMTKPNGGKASALNIGIKACRGEIIVALDADTVFAPDTVSLLVRHFSDPAIGAVSGNVKVGNRSNPLTIWQAVEYITSQNFDRRAYDLLNCITVVPGAIGAWRKDAVILAGLYSSQTLAEDTDLTFKIRKLGYRITTDNSALAYTEAPDNLRNLAKQRFRWAFGTLQCLWKHRTALFHPRYGTFGLVAMPSLWIYQIGFQALAPLVDFTILWAWFYHQFITPISDHKDLTMLLGYWAVFSTVELLGAFLAFCLDREDKRLIGWLLLQRFVYRQLMYYVIIKSLFVAVRGSVVGWGKFERRGTVRQPLSPIVREQGKALSPVQE